MFKGMNKFNQKNAVNVPVGLDEEKIKQQGEIYKAMEKITKILEDNNLELKISQQIVVAPKANANKTDKTTSQETKPEGEKRNTHIGG